MKTKAVISVENISKKYSIGEKQSYLTLREQIVNLPKKFFTKQNHQEFWALKNISFEVNKGDVLGIIGRNGAGKSTLLKILSRITEPSTGQITMRGRVASLLEVGTGFNPELTGRENIYLNGSILGMSRKEISRKFKEIVDFADIGDFLDTPVKRYSSGMYVRLAFAVSAHLDADILLVDEVLAVGDIEFQKKCLNKMNKLASGGKTVIFISHNIPSINRLCNRCIWIQKGKIVKSGETRSVINSYINSTDQVKKIVKTGLLQSTCGRFTLEKCEWVDMNGKPVKYYIYGEENILRYTIKFKKQVRNVGFGFAILGPSGDRILTSHQVDDEESNIPKTLKGKITLELNVGLKTIAPGKYRTIIGARDQISMQTILYSEEHAPLIIRETNKKIDGSSGYLWQTGKWKLIKDNK